MGDSESEELLVTLTDALDETVVDSSCVKVDDFDCVKELVGSSETDCVSD